MMAHQTATTSASNSPKNSRSVFLGKRKSEAEHSSEIEGDIRRKFLILANPRLVACSERLADKQLISANLSQKLGSEVSMHRPFSFTFLSSRADDISLFTKASDSGRGQVTEFDSIKKNLLIFLTETIETEQFNLKNFSSLCSKETREFALLFMKSQFGFELNSLKYENTSSLKDCLRSCSRRRKYRLLNDSRVSLSFVLNCYLQMLKKQLKAISEALPPIQIFKILHQRLGTCGFDTSFETFLALVERICAFDDSLTEADISIAICKPLQIKLLSLSKGLLVKFYKADLRRKLASIIMPCTSLEDLRENLQLQHADLDFLSSYIDLKDGDEQTPAHLNSPSRL